jgi:hypothetical protein
MVRPAAAGNRFGAVDALHSGLPADAVNPSGRIAKADEERRQNLSKFADYYGRAKSFGKQIPITKRMSDHRASALRLGEQEKKRVQDIDFVLVSDGKVIKLWLYKVRNDDGWYWYFVEHDIVSGRRRKSKRYWSRANAAYAYREQQITWVGIL